MRTFISQLIDSLALKKIDHILMSNIVKNNKAFVLCISVRFEEENLVSSLKKFMAHQDKL